MHQDAAASDLGHAMVDALHSHASVEFVISLIDSKASVNGVCGAEALGRTPLHWAAALVRSDVGIALIERGADIDAINSIGWTPLHTGVTNNTMGLVHKLLECKSNVNRAESGYGWTALHLAVQNRNKSMIKLLLDYRAMIDVRDRHGRSALQQAILHDDERMALMLLKRGASLQMVQLQLEPQLEQQLEQHAYLAGIRVANCPCNYDRTEERTVVGTSRPKCLTSTGKHDEALLYVPPSIGRYKTRQHNRTDTLIVHKTLGCFGVSTSTTPRRNTCRR
jgi:hypothetical protein